MYQNVSAAMEAIHGGAAFIGSQFP